MAGKSNYLEGAILDHIFRTTALAQPATLHIGLFTAAPSDAGGGTEVTGNAYGRATVTRGNAQWNAPAGTPRSISNVSDITFSTPSPAGWGTVTHFGIFDAAAPGGNLLYWAALSQAKVINAGDTVKFTGGAPGQLTIQED